jgi:uncharacterized protein YsxB (DUF464 family)
VVAVLKGNFLNLVLKRMAEGYEEQVPSYEKMLQLAEQQKAVLAQEEINIERLLDLIDRRQELIILLEKMNEGLTSLKEEIKEALGIEKFNMSSIKKELAGPGVEALSTSLQRMGNLLSEIKELDQKNEASLRLMMQKTEEQLQSLQEQKKAEQAYQPTPSAEEGVFIDYSK